MIRNASRFRHWLIIENYSEQKSDLGQSVQSWTFVDQFWGSITQLSGDEKVFVTQLYPLATHKIECRDPGYRITAVMRFLFVDHDNNLRAFNIISPNNLDERGYFYEIIVREVFGESGVVLPPLPVTRSHSTDTLLV